MLFCLGRGSKPAILDLYGTPEMRIKRYKKKYCQRTELIPQTERNFIIIIIGWECTSMSAWRDTKPHTRRKQETFTRTPTTFIWQCPHIMPCDVFHTPLLLSRSARWLIFSAFPLVCSSLRGLGSNLGRGEYRKIKECEEKNERQRNLVPYLNTSWHPCGCEGLPHPGEKFTFVGSVYSILGAGLWKMDSKLFKSQGKRGCRGPLSCPPPRPSCPSG